MDAGLECVGRRAQVGEHHTVIAGIGLGEARKLATGPVESAAIDDHAGDRGAVAAEVLGGRVHDDVRAVGDGLDQVRRRDRVVHDQRYTVVMGDTRHPGDVEDVDLRVGDRLGVEGLGVRPHRRPPGIKVIGIVDERGLDSQLGQRVVQEVVGAAVQPGTGHDVIAGSREIENREGLGSLAGRQEQRRHPALECGDPRLDDTGGRVHQPGVDIARFGEAEQCRGMFGVVEGVGRRLVDRQGPGVGIAIRTLAGVDLFGLKRPLCFGVSHQPTASLGRAGFPASVGARQGGPALAVQPTATAQPGHHPRHPTAVGGLPASKPGLNAGTHDRVEFYPTSAVAG